MTASTANEYYGNGHSHEKHHHHNHSHSLNHNHDHSHYRSRYGNVSRNAGQKACNVCSHRTGGFMFARPESKRLGFSRMLIPITNLYPPKTATAAADRSKQSEQQEQSSMAVIRLPSLVTAGSPSLQQFYNSRNQSQEISRTNIAKSNDSRQATCWYSDEVMNLKSDDEACMKSSTDARGNNRRRSEKGASYASWSAVLSREARFDRAATARMSATASSSGAQHHQRNEANSGNNNRRRRVRIDDGAMVVGGASDTEGHRGSIEVVVIDEEEGDDYLKNFLQLRENTSIRPRAFRTRYAKNLFADNPKTSPFDETAVEAAIASRKKIETLKNHGIAVGIDDYDTDKQANNNNKSSASAGTWNFLRSIAPSAMHNNKNKPKKFTRLPNNNNNNNNKTTTPTTAGDKTTSSKVAASNSNNKASKPSILLSRPVIILNDNKNNKQSSTNNSNKLLTKKQLFAATKVSDAAAAITPPNSPGPANLPPTSRRSRAGKVSNKQQTDNRVNKDNEDDAESSSSSSRSGSSANNSSLVSSVMTQRSATLMVPSPIERDLVEMLSEMSIWNNNNGNMGNNNNRQQSSASSAAKSSSHLSRTTSGRNRNHNSNNNNNDMSEDELAVIVGNDDNSSSASLSAASSSSVHRNNDKQQASTNSTSNDSKNKPMVNRKLSTTTAFLTPSSKSRSSRNNNNNSRAAAAEASSSSHAMMSNHGSQRPSAVKRQVRSQRKTNPASVTPDLHGLYNPNDVYWDYDPYTKSPLFWQNMVDLVETPPLGSAGQTQRQMLLKKHQLNKRRTSMMIAATQVQRHRNVLGEDSFYAYKFDDEDGDGKAKAGRRKSLGAPLFKVWPPLSSNFVDDAIAAAGAGAAEGFPMLQRSKRLRKNNAPVARGLPLYRSFYEPPCR